MIAPSSSHSDTGSSKGDSWLALGLESLPATSHPSKQGDILPGTEVTRHTGLELCRQYLKTIIPMSCLTESILAKSFQSVNQQNIIQTGCLTELRHSSYSTGFATTQLIDTTSSLRSHKIKEHGRERSFPGRRQSQDGLIRKPAFFDTARREKNPNNPFSQ